MNDLGAVKIEEGKEYMSCVLYASAVGSIMYAMVCNRPNITHAISVVSKFMGNPRKSHWEGAKFSRV